MAGFVLLAVQSSESKMVAPKLEGLNNDELAGKKEGRAEEGRQGGKEEGREERRKGKGEEGGNEGGRKEGGKEEDRKKRIFIKGELRAKSPPRSRHTMKTKETTSRNTPPAPVHGPRFHPLSSPRSEALTSVCDAAFPAAPLSVVGLCNVQVCY